MIAAVLRLTFLVLALLAWCATDALACNDPSLGSFAATAHAGDTVTFSAVHLDPGAAYTLSLGGRELAAGTAEGGVVTGSFSVPDLDASGTYYVELRVEHEDGTWLSSQPLVYAATAPPPPAPPVASRHVAPVRSMPVPRMHVATPHRTVPPRPAHAVHVARAAPIVAPVRVAAPRRHRAATHRAAATRRRNAAPSFVRIPRELPRLAAAVPAPRMERPVTRTNPDRPLLEPLLIVLGAAALAVAAALAARRRRRAAAIEAELQELIAEARAGDDARLRG